MSGVCEAFAEAVGAIARQSGQIPLPKGVTTAETPDWKLAVNASLDPAEHEGSPIGPYEVRAEHRHCFVIAVFDPNGGIIGGGLPEDDFIAQMKAISPEQPA